jgi:hypothetical protein
MFLTFLATFSVFPAALSKIKSVDHTNDHQVRLWPDRLFVPIMTFLLFFIGETVGRMISSKVHRPRLSQPRILFLLCLLRFIFIPLFAFCNFPITKDRLYAFKHDAVYGIIVFIFASSHGYCNSLNLMYAPRRVQAQLSGTVGALMMMVCILLFLRLEKYLIWFIYLGTCFRYIHWFIVILWCLRFLRFN